MYGVVAYPQTKKREINIKDMEAVEADFCPKCGDPLKKNNITEKYVLMARIRATMH